MYATQSRVECRSKTFLPYWCFHQKFVVLKLVDEEKRKDEESHMDVACERARERDYVRVKLGKFHDIANYNKNIKSNVDLEMFRTIHLFFSFYCIFEQQVKSQV